MTHWNNWAIIGITDGHTTLNIGLRTMCHQKDPTFSHALAFTERPPFLPNFTQWPPIFNKLLVTERPDTSLSLKDPSFLHLIVKQVTIFGKKLDFSKISTNLTKCWEIFGHFGPKSPYFLCISLKDPLFLCTLSLKDPLFWCNLSPKNPYIWCAWWHSYVTFKFECIPPGYITLRCHFMTTVVPST